MSEKCCETQGRRGQDKAGGVGRGRGEGRGGDGREGREVTSSCKGVLLNCSHSGALWLSRALTLYTEVHRGPHSSSLGMSRGSRMQSERHARTATMARACTREARANGILGLGLGRWSVFAAAGPCDVDRYRRILSQSAERWTLTWCTSSSSRPDHHRRSLSRCLPRDISQNDASNRESVITRYAIVRCELLRSRRVQVSR